MKRKLHNFNTMDFLFFLVAIFPLVFPLFCMLCSALATESTTLINFNFDNNFFPITYLDNILGLKTFNDWLVANVIHNNSDFVYMLLGCTEWYLFVYLFRMSFDFLMVIPNIVHNFVHKLGGTSSD